MSEPLRVLFVGGHPHDTIAQVGGTLALHARAGDQVTAVALTSGGYTHTAKYHIEVNQGKIGLSLDGLEDAAREMAEQVRAACAELGYTDVRFLRVNDDIVDDGYENVRLVEELIREIRPNIIVTHHPMGDAGIGLTHSICGQIVMKAYAAAAGVRPGSPPGWIPGQIFFITPPQFTSYLDTQIPRQPVVFVDVREFMQAKMRAEMKVTSQFRWLSARKKHECMEGYWGIQVQMPYCEVFTPYFPEIYSRLPLSDYRRNRTHFFDLEWAKEMSAMVIQEPENE